MKFSGLTNDDYSLKPDDETLVKLKKIVMPGICVVGNVDIDKDRSLKQHRRYFGILGGKVASIPEKTVRAFYERLLDMLMMTSHIDKELIHELLKKLYSAEKKKEDDTAPEMDSIAFAVASQHEANNFYQFADEMLKRLTNEDG